MSFASTMQSEIYIHTSKSREQIAGDLARLLQAKILNAYTVEDQANRYTIYIKINKGGFRYEDVVQISYPKFYDFCYYLDYSPEDDLEEQVSVDIVTKILKYFWDNNIPAVAACEYSEQLPMNGGDSPEALWPNRSLP